ncbi:MAG TPA: AMP-binding protein [Rhodopila sp.]
MAKLTDFSTYADAQLMFSTAGLWELFDGNRERLNIGHECVDRHASPGRVALRIARADGSDETITFVELAAWSSRVAHWLEAEGVRPGDRVAIMLEPSLLFYAALFGAVKRGAVAVPLFTLFGADGVRLRTRDCAPSLLLSTAEKRAALGELDGVRVVAADDGFMAAMAAFPDGYETRTASSEMAIFQYTSGTTRELPEAIRHTHRAVVVVMNAALYGTGLRPGDRFFCPSSPAWGHGLWHGTLAPLALGIETGAYSGKFDAERLLRALGDFGSTNLSAAATHYRMMRDTGRVGDYRTALRKLSFTGEPIDQETAAFIQAAYGVPL